MNEEEEDDVAEALWRIGEVVEQAVAGCVGVLEVQSLVELAASENTGREMVTALLEVMVSIGRMIRHEDRGEGDENEVEEATPDLPTRAIQVARIIVRALADACCRIDRRRKYFAPDCARAFLRLLAIEGAEDQGQEYLALVGEICQGGDKILGSWSKSKRPEDVVAGFRIVAPLTGRLALVSRDDALVHRIIISHGACNEVPWDELMSSITHTFSTDTHREGNSPQEDEDGDDELNNLCRIGSSVILSTRLKVSKEIPSKELGVSLELFFRAGIQGAVLLFDTAVEASSSHLMASAVFLASRCADACVSGGEFLSPPDELESLLLSLMFIALQGQQSSDNGSQSPMTICNKLLGAIHPVRRIRIVANVSQGCHPAFAALLISKVPSSLKDLESKGDDLSSADMMAISLVDSTLKESRDRQWDQDTITEEADKLISAINLLRYLIARNIARKEDNLLQKRIVELATDLRPLRLAVSALAENQATNDTPIALVMAILHENIARAEEQVQEYM